MNEDFMHEAAEHALAASMKEFQDKVAAASGLDLKAPAVTLTWQQVADRAFGYLIEIGLNPLEVPKDDLAYLIEKVSDGLDYAFGDGGQWVSILNDLMPTPLLKAEAVEVDSNWPFTSDVDDLLAHERDCRCPRCEGEAPEESRLDRIEDSHLEAEYEDRVSGCDWDF